MIEIARRLVMALSTAGVLALMPIGEARAQLVGFPETATLGFVLNSFADRLETSMVTAANAAQGVAVQGGTQGYILIQSARQAYADSLDKTLKGLDSTTTKKIQEIQSVVQDLQSNVEQQVNNAAAQAQQIANTLPISNTVPQLRNFSPKFIDVSESAGQAEIVFRGNFLDAHREGFKPSLQVGDHEFRVSENTTQSLKFHPVTVAFGQPIGDRLATRKLKLKVPYEEGWWIFKSHRTATYDVLIGTLPRSPGKVVLERKVVTPKNERQHIRTQGWAQHSSNDDHKNVLYNAPPPPDGWSVVPTSARFIVESSDCTRNDEWSESLVREVPTVVWSATTIHHRIGCSGKVNFHLEYDIERNVQLTDWSPEEISLTWGQSRAILVEPNGWRVKFDTFDGNHQEFAAPNTSSRFLKARIEGANLVLQIPRASDIEY